MQLGEREAQRRSRRRRALAAACAPSSRARRRRGRERERRCIRRPTGCASAERHALHAALAKPALATRGRRRRRPAAPPPARGAPARARPRGEHELVHSPRVAEAHLDLGRMHVDVDARADRSRGTARRPAGVAVQHVVVGCAHRVREQLVAHEAAVDEEVLRVGARARAASGVPARPRSAAAPPLVASTGGAGGEVRRRARRRRARARRLRAQHVRTDAAVVPDVKPTSGRASACGEQPRRSGRTRSPRSQELAPRRRVEEELAHFDRGAAARAPPAAARRLRAFEPRSRCVRRVARRGCDRQARHRGDRGQRLAAKAHASRRASRSSSVAILLVAWRASASGSSSRAMPRAVVARRCMRLMPPAARSHVDLAGAGVERVLEQLLHHRGRPLDHLAGGDLADQELGQVADRAHGQVRAPAAAGDAHQLVVGQAEHRVRMPGRRPQLAVRGQALLDERALEGSAPPAARRRWRSRCWLRTKSASALPTGSPTQRASRARSTRFAPDDMTSNALSLASARNTSELAICADLAAEKLGRGLRGARGAGKLDDRRAPVRRVTVRHARVRRSGEVRTADMRGSSDDYTIGRWSFFARFWDLVVHLDSASRGVRRASTAPGSTGCCSSSCSAKPAWW